MEIHSEFLRFLLVSTHAQARVLLQNTTKGQVNAISEICYNILHGADIDAELLTSLKKHSNLIRKIGDGSRGVVARRKDISLHSRIIWQILLDFESHLPI